MARPKANSNFFKTWTHSMAYILGFIVTDGCLIEDKNGYHTLNITNKNKEILQDILKAMSSNHKISIKPRGGVPNLKYFQIQIRDRIIYSDLLKLGLTPRKSKTIKLPDVPSKFFGNFVRGCFDGDGSITIWQDPRWRHPWQMRTVFSSGSYAFLCKLEKRLHKEANLSRVNIQHLRRDCELCYSIADSIKLNEFMYQNVDYNSPYLRGKRNKFKFFKKIRPDWFRKIIKINTMAPSSSPA